MDLSYVKPPQLIRYAGTGAGIGRFKPDIWEGDPVEWAELHQLDAEKKAEAQAALEEAIKKQVPRAIKAGPMVFTSNTTLEKWPTVVWDVNNYYRELGVHWSASTREIRTAYQALRGDESVRLTYIVKQLLNPAVRRAYDATEFGSVFFDDYIAQYVKDQITRDLIKENDGRMPTFDEQQEMATETIDLQDFINKSINPSPKNWTDDNVEFDLRWRWGYYLLGTDIYDTNKLREWQLALIQELAAREAIVRLSVGITNGPAKVCMVESMIVAFIGIEESPASAMVSEAADKILHLATQTVN